MLEHNNFNWKHFIVVGGLILVFAAGASALWFSATRDETEQQAVQEEITPSPVCSRDENQEVVIKGAQAIVSPKSDENEKSLNAIKALESYDSDPNCLFMTVRLNNRLWDYEQASAELAKLELVYESDEAIANYFGGNALTLEELKGEVEESKQLRDELDDRTNYFEAGDDEAAPSEVELDQTELELDFNE